MAKARIETIGYVVSRNIIRFRKKSGLTQAKLAQAAGITAETVARLERAVRGAPSANSNPCIMTLDNLASAMGTTIEALVSRRSRRG